MNSNEQSTIGTVLSAFRLRSIPYAMLDFSKWHDILVAILSLPQLGKHFGLVFTGIFEVTTANGFCYFCLVQGFT